MGTTQPATTTRMGTTQPATTTIMGTTQPATTTIMGTTSPSITPTIETRLNALITKKWENNDPTYINKINNYYRAPPPQPVNSNFGRYTFNNYLRNLNGNINDTQRNQLYSDLLK
jgi:hypothetical protein